MSADYEEDGEYYPPQPVPRASRVYAPPTQRQTETVPAPKPPRKRRSILPVGIGMFIVVGTLLIFQHVIAPSYVWASDQWHYGDARMTQLDANVGHGGTSHFIAEYYHGSVIILELAPQQFHSYYGERFPGRDAAARSSTDGSRHQPRRQAGLAGKRRGHGRPDGAF